MKKLLLKILLLAFLVALILSLRLLLPVPDNDPGYYSAIIDKHKRLQNIKPPRIIFVGGSNLAFGLDSELIEKAIKMNAVNMGIKADVGLRYNLSEIEPYIKQGDVIVIIPEYEEFFGDCFEGGEALAIVFFNFPEGRKYLKSSKQYFAVLRSYPRALRINLFNLLMGRRFHLPFDYCRKAFNVYGDSVGHLNKGPQPSGNIQYSELKGDMNKDVIPALNSFKVYAEKNGAKLFFIYPCLMDIQYERNEEKINLLNNTLKKKMDISMLSTPSEYVFPKPYFYDTVYHFTGEGRRIRTLKIIADLEKALHLEGNGYEK
jgi:hypothetical protein